MKTESRDLGGGLGSGGAWNGPCPNCVKPEAETPARPQGENKALEDLESRIFYAKTSMESLLDASRYWKRKAESALHPDTASQTTKDENQSRVGGECGAPAAGSTAKIATSDVPSFDEKNITRLEVICEYGRAFTRWQCAIQLSVQDNGRTLKVFVQARGDGETVNTADLKSADASPAGSIPAPRNLPSGSRYATNEEARAASEKALAHLQQTNAVDPVAQPHPNGLRASESSALSALKVENTTLREALEKLAAKDHWGLDCIKRDYPGHWATPKNCIPCLAQRALDEATKEQP